MPKKAPREPRPETNPPAVATPALSGTSPAAPAALPTLDLTKYRKGTAPPEEPDIDEPETPGRPRDPKVRLAELAGIEGAHVVDYFDGHGQYGPWVALKLAFPGGERATCFVSGNTAAYPATVDAMNGEAFAGLDEIPPIPCPVHVRLRAPRMGPDGKPERAPDGTPKKPTVLVRFG